MLPEVLDVPVERIVFKRRERQRGAAQYDDAEYKRRVQHLALELEMQVCGCAD